MHTAREAQRYGQEKADEGGEDAPKSTMEERRASQIVQVGHRGDQDDQRGGEDRQGGDQGPGQARDLVADEGGGDDDWARGYLSSYNFV